MNKLNLFKPQMKIRVKDHTSGEFYDGMISSHADWSTEPCWWVSYLTREGVTDVLLATEDDLIQWNYGTMEANLIKCTCGSSAVNHPGHAYHCLLIINGLTT